MDRSAIDSLLKVCVGLSSDAIEALAEYSGVGLLNIHIPSGEIKLNRTIAQLAGYELGEIPHTFNTREMLTFEEDRPMVNECIFRLMSGESNRYQIEYRMKRRDNSIVAVHENAIVYERDSDGMPVRIAALCLDLSRLRWAEEKARKMERENKMLAESKTEGEFAEQNRLLRAANSAAAMIIGGFHQDYETVLRQSLQILGESIQANRACIFRNIEKDGQLCCFLRTEWCDEKNVLFDNHNFFIDYETLLPNWKVHLKEHTYYCSKYEDLPTSLKVLPGISQAQNIIIAPLYLNGEFWGLLRFDDFTGKRTFTITEAEIMVSGVLVIASSISRNETFSKLNEARDQAMASTKAKSEFLSRMSHEIRTPLNAIIGMSSIAKKTNDFERIRYCLEKVDISSRQLLNLINDILDMSKIDSGKFEIINSDFDFEKMIQNVINVVQVKFEEKHQIFNVNFNSVMTRKIFSDELRLSQVLINLLNNASKFTPNNGKIVLDIQQTTISNDRIHLLVKVTDSGIGISKEKQGKLFQSFEQIDGSITRSYGGTGLGLSICKKIINLIGGDIWVESEINQGSTFIFGIEVGLGDVLLSNEISPSIKEDMRILVVDDAEDVREYFKHILSDFNLSCDIAYNGQSAIKMVKKSIEQERPYSIIFVDWHMPDMNGGMTASEIKRLTNDGMVIVLISVADWTDIEKEAKEYGVNYFLPKPVLPNSLYDIILKFSDNVPLKEKKKEKHLYNDWCEKSLLLVEDIEINREIICSILDDSNIQITEACNGEEAVEIFKKNPEKYDLILMDIQMPKLDGIAATKEIRQIDNARAKEVPIVAMTANAFKEDAQLCIDAGMNEHLAKPIDVNELFKVLSYYLNDLE